MTEAIKKVCIIGSAHTTLNEAPWKDDSFEFWCLAWRKAPKATRWFDMHTIGPHRKRVPQDYEEYLSRIKEPIYLVEENPKIPTGIAYPLMDVMNTLGAVDKHADPAFFSSSIAYMLGLAIHEKFNEIHIYGVDLVAKDEYVNQRHNTAYLIGLARGLGISVYLPPKAALLKFPYLYGYQEFSKGVLSRKILEDRLNQYNDKYQKAMAAAYVADGAKQEVQQLLELLDYHERGGYVDQGDGK
jgi:hypothetical protein